MQKGLHSIRPARSSCGSHACGTRRDLLLGNARTRTSHRLSAPSLNFGRLDAVETLDLMDNDFQIALPDLTKLARVRFLRLSENAFSGTIGPLPESVEHVDLARNRLSGFGSRFLVGEALRTLRLHDNEMVGTVPSMVRAKIPFCATRIFFWLLTSGISSCG